MATLVSFNLEQARAFALANKKENGLNVELVIDAINSIHSRNEYLKYFYDLFLDVTTKQKLVFDRVNFREGNGITTRHKYEALAFAFLSNLHEMIDSYPFMYLAIYKDKINNAKYLNWDKLNSFKEHVAVAKMFELKEGKLFIKLDNINNRRKHRALPRVAKQFKYLEINTTDKAEVQYQNLKELMCELHDFLLPKYFEVLNLTFAKV